MYRKIIKKYKEFKANRLKRLLQRKILVFGGYGYGNVGDEAQLSAVIRRLNNLFSDYEIRVLSPNVEYTKTEHEYHDVAEAPRVAFFRQGESILYDMASFNKNRGFIYNMIMFILQICFFIKSMWIYFNAWLVKYDICTIFLNPSASALLYDMRTSKMFYFEGGGYLTGNTLSRLWDAVLICMIGKLYNVKIVMSGQTIGIWGNSFNKFYAKLGFRGVDLITTRDPVDSLRDLAEVNIKGSHVYEVCDDALFCEKELDCDVMNDVYEKSGCNDEFLSLGYATWNFHYWGIDDKNAKDDLLNDINRMIDDFRKQHNLNIIFIPMTPSDIEPMQDYMNKFPSSFIRILNYKFDFRIMRSVIADSRICITMKHHPIIFSVGELTPVITLNNKKYYEHKNNGALKILGLSEFSLSLEDDAKYELFNKLIAYIWKSEDDLKKRMNKNLIELKSKVDSFEKDLIKVMAD